MDLFPPVKEWLEEHGYDVFSDVESDYGCNRADVVGVCGPVVAVVQLKTALSVNVIGQAIDWLPYANIVYIGVPEARSGVNPHATKILRHFGIGVLRIYRYNRFGLNSWCCSEHIKAMFNRHAVTNWKSKLTDDYKNGPPGRPRRRGLSYQVPVNDEQC